MAAYLLHVQPDQLAARAIRQGLHQIGRRITQLRAVCVYSDTADAHDGVDLPARTVARMDRSRFLLAVLSPSAAGCDHLDKTIGYWLQERGRQHLLLALTGGRLHWDEAHARFDPATSDAAPAVLTQAGVLPVEPFYIDISADEPWDPRSPALRDKLTTVAASIHGTPKDQLAGDDLHQQRRFRRIRAGAI